MKTALLILLFALSLAGHARASGAPSIEIITSDAGIGYTLHKEGYGISKETMTPDEIETWLRAHSDHTRELVIIYPDDRTSFRTVRDILRRLKSAGVRMYSVVTYEDAIMHSVSGLTDKVWSERYPTPPAK